MEFGYSAGAIASPAICKQWPQLPGWAVTGCEFTILSPPARFRTDSLADLQQGIGVNTSETVVGKIGSTRRLDYNTVGDAVNTAQRLQSLAGGGQIQTFR